MVSLVGLYLKGQNCYCSRDTEVVKTSLKFFMTKRYETSDILNKNLKKACGMICILKKLTSALQCFLPLCSLVSSQILERILLRFTGESFHSRIQVVLLSIRGLMLSTRMSMKT